MLNFGNKEFRNLQEQVLYLSNRSNFGLNIKGEVKTVPQLGDIPNTNIGDVYLVGKAAPFNFYIKTADKTWTNLGKLESNVPGPQGLQGIQGIKGTDGSVIYTNNQPESANNGDLYISNDGKLYQYDNEWKLVTSLRGSVGPVGPMGPQGEQGLQGKRGERGEKGDTGIGIRIGGNVATEDLLPSKPVGDTNAYLVGHGSPYELYVWNGTGWLNSGEFGTLDNIQVITIKAPETATSGQLDAGQLNQVLESTSALIKHGNLIYRKEAVISTKVIYRCITDDFLYVISVNTDTGSWVKTSQGLPSQTWTVDAIPDKGITPQKTSFAINEGNLKSFLNGGVGSIPEHISLTPAKVYGKNLFNKNDLYPNCYVSYNSGLRALTNGTDSTGLIEIERNVKYCWNCTYTHISFWDEHRTYISGVLVEGTIPATFTTPANAKYVILSLNHNDIDKAQLEKGYWASPYEPFISSKYDLKVELGTNLLDDYHYIGDKYINYNGGEIGTQSGTNIYDYISVTPNTKYYFSMHYAHVCWFNKNKVYISGDLVTNSSTFLTSPANAYYLVVSVNPSNLFNGVFQTDTEVNTWTDFKKLYYYYDYKGIKHYKTGRGEIHFNVDVNNRLLGTSNNGDTYNDDNNQYPIPAVAMLPDNYDSELAPTKLCMIFHGAGYGVEGSRWGYYDNPSDKDFIAFIKKGFLDNGFVVCDINGFETTFPFMPFGNYRTTLAYRKLYEYMIQNFNIKEDIVCYGFSMGGLHCLNFTFDNQDIVSAVALGSPVVAQQDEAWVVDPAWRRFIANSCEFEGYEDYNPDNTTGENLSQKEKQYYIDNIAKTLGSDPYRHIAKADGKEYIYRFPPIRIWHGTADVAVPYKYSQRLINAMFNGGCMATLRLMNDKGHELCYGGNDVATVEYGTWLKRFKD